jgi:exodeoxyribonuclease VII small subunit
MTDEKKAAPVTAGEDGELTFEQALARLEKIVQEMEQGRLPLEECLKRFEEGSRLRTFCQEYLGKAEEKIEILLGKENGTEEWAPFAPDQA